MKLSGLRCPLALRPQSETNWPLDALRPGCGGVHVGRQGPNVAESRGLRAGGHGPGPWSLGMRAASARTSGSPGVTPAAATPMPATMPTTATTAMDTQNVRSCLDLNRGGRLIALFTSLVSVFDAGKALRAGPENYTEN